MGGESATGHRLVQNSGTRHYTLAYQQLQPRSTLYIQGIYSLYLVYLPSRHESNKSKQFLTGSISFHSLSKIKKPVFPPEHNVDGAIKLISRQPSSFQTHVQEELRLSKTYIHICHYYTTSTLRININVQTIHF